MISGTSGLAGGPHVFLLRRRKEGDLSLQQIPVAGWVDIRLLNTKAVFRVLPEQQAPRHRNEQLERVVFFLPTHELMCAVLLVGRGLSEGVATWGSVRHNPPLHIDAGHLFGLFERRRLLASCCPCAALRG